MLWSFEKESKLSGDKEKEWQLSTKDSTALQESVKEKASRTRKKVDSIECHKKPRRMRNDPGDGGCI